MYIYQSLLYYIFEMLWNFIVCKPRCKHIIARYNSHEQQAILANLPITPYITIMMTDYLPTYIYIHNERVPFLLWHCYDRVWTAVCWDSIHHHRQWTMCQESLICIKVCICMNRMNGGHQRSKSYCKSYCKNLALQCFSPNKETGICIIYNPASIKTI